MRAVQNNTDDSALASEVTSYLETTAPQQLTPRHAPELSVMQLVAADWEMGRSLYIEVGGPW